MAICTARLVDPTFGTIVAFATIPNTWPQEKPAIVPIHGCPVSLLPNIAFELVLAATALSVLSRYGS